VVVAVLREAGVASVTMTGGAYGSHSLLISDQEAVADIKNRR